MGLIGAFSLTLEEGHSVQRIQAGTRFSSSRERPARLSVMDGKIRQSYPSTTAYRDPDISPGRCIPFTYSDRPFIAECVEGQSNVGDIGNPECLEVVPHHSKLRSGVQNS